MSYVFSFTFFFTAAHFLLALVAASISHFVTAATKFSCCSSNKKCLLCFFISRSRSLLPFFSLSFAGLPLFLCLSLALYSKCVELNTLENTNTETIYAFRFCLYWLFSCLCFTDAGGYAISLLNNLELHLGYHTCWLSYFTLVCLWCGRTVGRTVTWLPNFLGWVVYHIFLPMVLRRRASRARAPLW